MSDAKKGANHPMFGKTGENNPRFGKPKTEGSGRPSQQIEVFDQYTSITSTYDSINEAARALNIPRSSIQYYKYINVGKPYKNRYIFKKL
jgi:hypothetical protein